MMDLGTPLISASRRGETEEILLLRLNRPEKRNAINDEMILTLLRLFSDPPAGVKVVVLHGAGDHFSAGLDLSEHKERSAAEVMAHSQLWHRAFAAMETSGLPVVCAMQGGVIGGGLELAATAHVRVAETSCFYTLPEGQRGIYVGGGASVRVARIIGAHRMVEMMLTGRVYGAQEGQALGLSHYLVGPGEALDKALALAEKILTNAPLANYAILTAISHIADMPRQSGFFTESLMAALVQTDTASREGMRAFLERRKNKESEAPENG